MTSNNSHWILTELELQWNLLTHSDKKNLSDTQIVRLDAHLHICVHKLCQIEIIPDYAGFGIDRFHCKVIYTISLSFFEL